MLPGGAQVADARGAATMMWLWLNISLSAIFFVAVTGISLWIVIKHPGADRTVPGETGRAPETVGTAGLAGLAGTAAPVGAASASAGPGKTQQTGRPAGVRWRADARG